MTELGRIGTFERVETEPLVTFSEDGSTLATVDRDVVTLWDVENRAPITSFTEDAPPTDVAVAPDGRTVALAIDHRRGNDTITIWDAVERVRFGDLPLSSTAGEVRFHANGNSVAATDGDRMRFWDLDPEQAISRICTTLGRGLTREEWTEFVGDQPYRATCPSRA